MNPIIYTSAEQKRAAVAFGDAIEDLRKEGVPALDVVSGMAGTLWYLLEALKMNPRKFFRQSARMKVRRG